VWRLSKEQEIWAAVPRATDFQAATYKPFQIFALHSPMVDWCPFGSNGNRGSRNVTSIVAIAAAIVAAVRLAKLADSISKVVTTVQQSIPDAVKDAHAGMKPSFRSVGWAGRAIWRLGVLSGRLARRTRRALARAGSSPVENGYRLRPRSWRKDAPDRFGRPCLHWRSWSAQATASYCFYSVPRRRAAGSDGRI
jgi:hypothetical protein